MLAHASPGMLWVTIQTHRNVISCALTKDIGTVLSPAAGNPTGRLWPKRMREGIVLLTTGQTTYEAAGKLWEAGLR